MKKTLSVFTIMLFVFSGFVLSEKVNADWKDKPLSLQSLDKYELNKVKRDYKSEKKINDIARGEIFDFYIDLQLGYGGTNANVSKTTNLNQNLNTESKGGITAGALMYFSLFQTVKFSTGLTFVGKKFAVQPQSTTTGSSQGFDSTTAEFSNNYLNIPLNMNFGGMVTDKVGLWFNGGPYFGLLLNTPSAAGYGYKNFDLGLTGTLTMNVQTSSNMSVILGTRVDYGGLNNLGSTQYIDKISTLNYVIFSGIRFSLAY
ncbi:MAG TPA: hypothetical protein DIS94_12815 [Bacteroidetes bacterium]|nr:hypothetical protein [Bacteroidota bacterium]